MFLIPYIEIGLEGGEPNYLVGNGVEKLTRDQMYGMIVASHRAMSQAWDMWEKAQPLAAIRNQEPER